MTLAGSLDHDASDTHTAAEPNFDYAGFTEKFDGGEHKLLLLVEGVHCGGCIARIERALQREPGVTGARLNFSTRRLTLSWQGESARANALAGVVSALGYRVVPAREADGGALDKDSRVLLRSLAVAGFAAANVMLLSIAVWAGHSQGMGAATRDLLHWFSALVALPAIVYAGRPFFYSAARALRGWGTNMDVPISLAILLTAGMSLFETVRGGPDTYFDSAVALLFFLLIGRYLDSRARGKARETASRLMSLGVRAVTALKENGQAYGLPIEQVVVGMRLLVTSGERVPADGIVLTGRSEVDGSLISGETLPGSVGPGDLVYAGTMNIGAPLTLTVNAVGEGTLLAEIVRLLEVAEQRRARFVALADRVARLYAPVVHGLAAVTFLGWVLLGGLAWQPAMLIAVAVLIITCPCALALAVPVVQVVASGRLMQQGILLKSATALERLAQVDVVVFDKTGTLTEGRPLLLPGEISEADLRAAARLAGGSRHPLARAITHAMPGVALAPGVSEVPGSGLVLASPEGEIRLGSRDWCGVSDGRAVEGPEIWLSRPKVPAVCFRFSDQARSDASDVVSRLKRRGYEVALLSGDRPETVADIAKTVGITDWQAVLKPADKVAALEALAAQGRRVLMVGDGLNDAPALAVAFVSLSPSTAADISQTAADAVFQGGKLAPVADILVMARRAERLVKQNFGLAFLYNAITIPLAVLGLVTPLFAALAMSSSSLVVVGNALRLGVGRRP